MPFRLVMDKLGKPSSISGLNAPGRIDSIVCELFPQHSMGTKTQCPLNCSTEAEMLAITISELIMVAKSLKKNKAPVSDEVMNDILETIIRCQPESILNVFNKYIMEGHFLTSW